MTQIYEGMFLLDNEVVRADWKRAKEVVTGTLEKHGGKIHAARRWDERRLAYPIQRRRRATYLLAYYEVPPEHITNLRRDFDLSESVLRYLITATEEVPAREVELSEFENSAEFVAPPPPEDDAAEPEVEVETSSDDEDEDGDGGRRRGRRGPSARAQEDESEEPDEAASDVEEEEED